MGRSRLFLVGALILVACEGHGGTGEGGQDAEQDDWQTRYPLPTEPSWFIGVGPLEFTHNSLFGQASVSTLSPANATVHGPVTAGVASFDVIPPPPAWSESRQQVLVLINEDETDETTLLAFDLGSEEGEALTSAAGIATTRQLIPTATPGEYAWLARVDDIVGLYRWRESETAPTFLPLSTVLPQPGLEFPSLEKFMLASVSDEVTTLYEPTTSEDLAALSYDSSGQVIGLLRGPASTYRSPYWSFSPDGATVAYCAGDHEMRFVSLPLTLDDSHVLQSVEFEEGCGAGAWSPDGERFFATNTIISYPDGWTLHNDLERGDHAAFSHSGRYLAVGGTTSYIFDTNTGFRYVLRRRERFVDQWQVAWSSDDEWLLVGLQSGDESLDIYVGGEFFPVRAIVTGCSQEFESYPSANPDFDEELGAVPCRFVAAMGAPARGIEYP